LDENPYVQIIDLSDAGTIPVSISEIARLNERFEQEVLQVVVVQAPETSRLMGRTLTKVAPTFQNFLFCDTLDEAINSAYELLAENKLRENGHE